MEKKKIAYITNLYAPQEIGGAEIYARKLIAQIKHEVDPFVITTSRFNLSRIFTPAVEVIDEVRVYRFYPLNICSPYALRKLPVFLKPLWHVLDLWNIHAYYMVKSILQKEKPDLVHTHNIAGFSTSIFRIIKKLSIPIVHTLHDYQLINPWAILFRGGKIIERFNVFEKFFQFVKRSTSKQIDIVTSPSKFVLDYHAKLNYFKSSKQITLRLGVDSIAENLEKSAMTTFNVLYIGQLVEHKGVDYLIRAFKNIKGDDYRLTIAGTGTEEAHLKFLARSDKRILFAGFVSGDQKAKHFQEASVTVLPSIWYDNSPVSIYESFQYGVPIIGSAIGGIPELVIDGYNGLTVTPRNEGHLEKAIRRVHDESELQKQFREHALESLKKYSFAGHCKELNQLYNSLT